MFIVLPACFCGNNNDFLARLHVSQTETLNLWIKVRHPAVTGIETVRLTTRHVSFVFSWRTFMPVLMETVAHFIYK